MEEAGEVQGPLLPIHGPEPSVRPQVMAQGVEGEVGICTGRKREARGSVGTGSLQSASRWVLGGRQNGTGEGESQGHDLGLLQAS